MDTTLDSGIRAAVATASGIVAALMAATVLLAVLVELVRRRGAAHPIVRLTERLLPGPSRSLAAAMIASVSLALPGTAGAAEVAPAPVAAGPAATPSDATTPDAPPRSLRDWLTAPRPTAGPTVRPAPPDSVSTTTTTGPGGSGTTARSPSPRRAEPTTPSTPPAVTAPAPPPAPAPAPALALAPAPATVTVTVEPGDCLWSIAAEHLGPTATNAEIDRAWRVIWAANRDAIGADPDLIHPGLVLTVAGPAVP